VGSETLPYECWAIMSTNESPRVVRINGQLAVYDNQPAALFKLGDILEANPGKQHAYAVRPATVTLEFRDE